MSVRRTARALGLHSPSSYRFRTPARPRPHGVGQSAVCGPDPGAGWGTLHPGLIDVSTPLPVRPAIKLRYAQIPRACSGSKFPPRVQAILQDLGLESRGGTSEAGEFQPPSWRSDLEREIDLIEEVARIHGYEHIPENRAVPWPAPPPCVSGSKRRSEGR